MSTEAIKRRSGYYWVIPQSSGVWEVAYWSQLRNEWSLCGSGGKVSDDHMDSIEEARLEH